MPQNSVDETDTSIIYLIGDESFLESALSTPTKRPFDEGVIEYLNHVSRKILSNPASKSYPDVTTFAFWIRKASLMNYSRLYVSKDGQYVVGRGVAFHVAPSNVPINFAYSLVSGLLAGNVNIVRVPSKHYPQVNMIVDAMKSTLEDFKDMSDYICLVKYGHDKTINDRLSSIADVRIIWGGDETISILRESPLKPRATEILFANRFSIAVIDSDAYIQIPDKIKVANDFYNDTYLTDQNACSSPRIVIWMGNNIDRAKTEFWLYAHDVVSQKYNFQKIQGVDKYLQSCVVASKLRNVHMEPSKDNLITRLRLDSINMDVIDCLGNSGFFLEYDAQNITEIKEICNNSKCQTIAYIGNSEMFSAILSMGVRGVDRIVPFGKTMDFELDWDGYDLISHLTRIVRIREK